MFSDSHGSVVVKSPECATQSGAVAHNVFLDNCNRARGELTSVSIGGAGQRSEAKSLGLASIGVNIPKHSLENILLPARCGPRSLLSSVWQHHRGKCRL